MGSKYKAGDEFIAKRNINQFFTKGGTYTIQSHGWMEDHYYLNDDEGGTMHGAPLDWLEEEFIPVSYGPIRTVKRREIVPGVYGDVKVLDVFSASVNLRFAEGNCNYGPSDLRFAARIFNEIADVLDEQSAEAKKEAA